jgi:predicted Zn finger-like uncharacterized protein
MAKLQAVCPHCDASFKLKDRRAVGRRVNCPTCGDPFTIELGDADDDLEFEDDDDFDDEPADDFEEDRRLPRRTTTAKKSKRTKAQKGTAAAIVIYAIAGVLVLGLLVSAGYFVSTMMKGSGELDTSYLPTETEIVFHMKVAELANSELLEDQMDQGGGGNPFGGFGGGPQEASPKDIRSITVGVAGLGNLDVQGLQNNPLAAMNALQQIQWVAVVQSTKRLIDDSAQNGLETKTHDGEEYWMPPFGGMAIWQAGTRTVLIGSEESVKGAIERGVGSKSFAKFSFVDGGRDIVVAVRPSDTNLAKWREPNADADKLLEMPGVPNSVKSLVKGLQEGMVGFAMGANVDSDVNVVLQFETDGDDRATSIETDLGSLIEFGRTSLNEYRDQMPPDAAELAQLLLDEIEIERKGSTVSVAARIPGDMKDKLERFPNDLQRAVARGQLAPPAAFDPPQFNPPAVAGPDEKPGILVPEPKAIFQVQGFTGNGTASIQAKGAITRAGGGWADLARFAYDDDAKEIHVGIRGGAVDTGPAKAALEKVGFTIGFTSLKMGGGNPAPANPLVEAPAAAPAGGFVPDPLHPRIAALRAADQRNLHQIGLAIHNYHEAEGVLPTGVPGIGGKTLLSWRVQLLPYLGQKTLYDKFRLDEAWDGPNNSQLLAQMPPVFRTPVREDVWKPENITKTTYITFNSFDNSSLMGDGTARFADAPDGLSNTIAVVEGGSAGHLVEWTKPDDVHMVHSTHLVFRADWNKEYPGFNVLFGDGSVRFYTKALESDNLKHMLTRNGGELVNRDQGAVALGAVGGGPNPAGNPVVADDGKKARDIVFTVPGANGRTYTAADFANALAVPEYVDPDGTRYDAAAGELTVRVLYEPADNFNALDAMATLKTALENEGFAVGGTRLGPEVAAPRKLSMTPALLEMKLPSSSGRVRDAIALRIGLSDGFAPNALAYGEVQVDSAKDQGGRDLRPFPLPAKLDYADKLLDIEPVNRFANGVNVFVIFNPPTGGTVTSATVKGTLKLKTADGAIVEVPFDLKDVTPAE